MISSENMDTFKEETHRACVAVGGKRLRNWILRKESHVVLNPFDCCCPLPARRDIQLDNEALSPSQFWSFADGFDNNNHMGDPLFDHDFYSLGQEFRQKVLAGEYDQF